MSNTNCSVARIKRYALGAIENAERHIERKNDHYDNVNVDLSESYRNISFKDCGELTYSQYLQTLIDEGKVSLRGLKPDATVFDEMIVDVNTSFFEQQGGYEYAKRFYEEAFHFAEKKFGADNILSAVMHADEINLWLSDVLSKPVYHYHMHIVALPVVEKQVLWSKRCKDKALVGTVKEIIHQISHSKKWKSPQKLDENGVPVYNDKGKAVLLPSYSILQDELFEHMQEAGFTGFERGERGSTAEHLDCIDFKVKESSKHLLEVQDKIEQAEKQFAALEPVTMEMDSVDEIGKKSITGKITMSAEEYGKMNALAKEGIASRGEITRLQGFNKSLGQHCRDLEKQLADLTEKCKPYLEAIKRFPDKVKTFLSDLLKPKEKPVVKPSPWDVGVNIHPPKKKSKGDLER